MKHSLNRLIELSAPTKVKLFNVGPNDSTKGVFTYNPELKDKIIENQSKDGRDLLPIDLAHLSLTNSETVAAHKSYGWFQLSVEDDGIYANNIQWTEEGKKLLENREFRFFSPAFETNENNEIVFIDNFALTNEPALRDLQPLVASKNENLKELNTMSDKPEEKQKEDESTEALEAEAMSPEDKDKLIADLTAQNAELKAKLDEVMAKMAEYDMAVVEAEKDEVLNSMELSKEEKDFFKAMELDQIKKYSSIRLSKQPAVVKEIDVEEQNKDKSFVNNKGPKHNTLSNDNVRLFNLPTNEEIKARAQKIANARKMK